MKQILKVLIFLTLPFCMKGQKSTVPFRPDPMLNCVGNELEPGTDCDTYGRHSTKFNATVSIRGTRVLVNVVVDLLETKKDYTHITGDYTTEYSLENLIPNYNENMSISISERTGFAGAEPCWGCSAYRKLSGNGIIDYAKARLDNPNPGCDLHVLGGDVHFNEILLIIK
jgi:hypothetical protein